MSHTFFLNLLAKKMAGEASPEELQQLESLMKANPDWAYQAEQIQNLWKDDSGTSTHDSELAYEHHLERMRAAGVDFPNHLDKDLKPKKSRKPILISSLAAAAVLVIIVAVWMGKPGKNIVLSQSKKFSEISSPIGSKTKLLLPDSSVVWLNAGSRLTYNEHFGSADRNVTLTGEAFFDVKKSTIPFIIHANTVQIKVLGTAFNVKAYPDEKTTETSLLRGRVEITLDKRPGELYILKPNEKLIVANEPGRTIAKPLEKKEPIALLATITHATDSSVIETSWVENKLVFEDEAFLDVAKKMERWYGVKIDFADEEVANYHVYGSFTSETIGEALDALKIGFHFSYKIDGNDITIAKNK